MGEKNRQNDWDQKEEGHSGPGSREGGQEELSEYIRVTSPGVLVVIVSLLVLLTTVIIWGFAGTLPVTETVTGVVVDTARYAQLYPDQADKIPAVEEGEIVVFCFVDASRYNGQAIREFGDDAELRMPDQNTYKGKIETRVMVPVSMEEAGKILFNNEWVLEKCVSQNYNWFLVIRPTEDLSRYTFTLSEVTLLTEEVAPIHFLMK